MKEQKNRYYKFSDGWFTYYVGVDTGEKKFTLDPETDVEVEAYSNYNTPIQRNEDGKMAKSAGGI